MEARLPVEAIQAVDRLSSLAWRRGHKEGRSGAGDDGRVTLRDVPIRLGRRGTIGSTRIAHRGGRRGGRRFSHRDGGAVRRRGRCTGRCTGCLGGGFIWGMDAGVSTCMQPDGCLGGGFIWELFIWELGVQLSASLSVADLGLGGRFARELEVSLEEGREVVERKVHEVLVLLTTSLKGSAAKALVRERGPLPIWFTGPLPKGVVVRERALAEAHLLVNARELRFVTVWKEAVNARELRFVTVWKEAVNAR